MDGLRGDDPDGVREAERLIQETAETGSSELGLVVLGLTRLPDSIGQLTQLHGLAVPGNHLTELPEYLGQITQLRTLFLVDNRLAELPKSLGQLTKLISLSVSSNQLTELPESIGQLTQLQRLDLGHNQLTVLPESLLKLTSLKELYLHGNEALNIPSEVLGPRARDVNHYDEARRKPPASPAAILDYYFRTRRGRRPLNEAKLILVGRGGVGKTCLIKRLLGQGFDPHERETPGIEIQPWEIELAPRGRALLPNLSQNSPCFE